MAKFTAVTMTDKFQLSVKSTTLLPHRIQKFLEQPRISDIRQTERSCCFMRKEILILTAVASLIMAATASAQSDAQIKSELIGYWMSPRHGYLIQNNGLMRMCPTVGPNRAMTTNRWDVRSGMFYQDGEPYKIVKLTKSEFDYEAVRKSGVQVNGKFVVTCPVGTVFPLYRTTRSRAEE